MPTRRVRIPRSLRLILLLLPIAACNLPSPSISPTATPATVFRVDTETPTAALAPSNTIERQPSATPKPPNVQDLIDRCPTPAEIAGVEAGVKLSFEFDPTAGTLRCRAADGSADLTLLQLRAYQVLIVMQRLTFDQPLPWTDLPLYAWFTSTIDGIRFRNDIQNSFCCDPPHTINLVTGLFALESDRWLQAENRDANIQSLMVLMIHEARHSQGFFHTCGTKDQTLEEMGAFGVQYWTYMWLAYHSDPAFMTPGGSQANLYRELNRDMAMKFLATSAAGSGPFCQQATLTPGPSPTVPQT
jgi:hypothetical protein